MVLSISQISSYNDWPGSYIDYQEGEPLSGHGDPVRIPFKQQCVDSNAFVSIQWYEHDMSGARMTYPISALVNDLRGRNLREAFIINAAV